MKPPPSLDSLPAIDREFLTRFARRAREEFGDEVEQIRLFGSRARGDHRIDSDLDLFVLHTTDDRNVRRALQDLASDLASEMEMPHWPSTFVVSRERFTELLKRERRIAKDIVREGILV